MRSGVWITVPLEKKVFSGIDAHTRGLASRLAIGNVPLKDCKGCGLPLEEIIKTYPNKPSKSFRYNDAIGRYEYVGSSSQKSTNNKKTILCKICLTKNNDVKT